MNKCLYFGDDYLKWGKLRNGAWKIESESPEELEKLQLKILQDKNAAAFAYFFAKEFSYKPYIMQKAILDSKDPKYAFLFAQSIKNADIKALQHIVVASKNIQYICKLACFVKQADRKPLEKIIIKSEKVKYAHMYLKHVKGANINNFKKIILKSNKPRYLYELAKHTTNKAEILQIEDAIINSKSFAYMRLFSAKIELANVERIEQIVLETDNIVEIKKFAKSVRRSKMKRFFFVL